MKFHNAPVERHTGGVDYRRVAVETVRDGLRPTSTMRFVRDDHRHAIVIYDANGTELRSIPMHRVASFDSDDLRPFVGQALAALPDDLAKAALVEVNAHRSHIEDNPERDWVTVAVTVEGERIGLAKIHRRSLVPGWPDPVDDDGLDEQLDAMVFDAPSLGSKGEVD